MGNEYDKRRSAAAAAAAAHSAVPSSYQRPYHYGQPQQQQQQLAEQQVPPPPPSNMAAAQHQQHWYGYHQHPAQQTQVGGWVGLSVCVSFSFTPLYWILGKAGHSLFHAKESQLLQKILFYSVLVSLLCVIDFESCNGSLVL
jgi:hypothetical protein